MAKSCRGIIVGFRVNASHDIQRKAEETRVQIFTFDTIYDLKDGVQKIMEASLGVQKTRVNVGKLKTLVIFKRDKKRQVVGARVVKGEVRKGNKIEVFRLENGQKAKADEGIGQGKIIGLQRNKKDIKKGQEGEEIGILYEGTGAIEEGDILVAYEIREKKIEL